MRAYVDSDVLIWHLRGEARAFKLLKRLKDSDDFDLWTGALQRAEVVFFMKPNEMEATELFLAEFATAPVDKKIVDRAGAIYRRYHPSHSIDVNDAFLAATVLETGGKLFTLNIKHYPIENLNVQKAW